MGTEQYTGRWLSLLLALGALALPACGSDKKDSQDPVHSDDGGSDDGGKGDASADERFAGCTTVIAKGSTTEQIQEALIEVKTKSVLCFEDGIYEIGSELSLTVNQVTIRGNPTNREAVVLEYKNQKEGKDAISVTSSDFTIEHLTLRNSHGNSIVVTGAERPTFRNLKVYWDAGSITDNGAYAVYPLSSSDVLIEDCEVVGAADAGIYVGQSKRIIVRNNVVRANVAGIEIENSDDALVTGNHTIDNTCGILVFVMPNLEKKDGARTIVENNIIESNNRANFGEKGTTVSFVPAGLGILTLANDGTEVRKNEIKGNGSSGVLAVSFGTYALICEATGGENCGAKDLGTDPDAESTYVHDNTFENNGTAPDEVVTTLFPGINPIENVLWDGRRPADDAMGEHFCVGANPSTLRVFGTQAGISFDRTMDITDPAAFDCTLPPPFEKLTLPQDG